MKIYVVYGYTAYEGSDSIKAFKNKEDAEKFIEYCEKVKKDWKNDEDDDTKYPTWIGREDFIYEDLELE